MMLQAKSQRCWWREGGPLTRALFYNNFFLRLSQRQENEKYMMGARGTRLPLKGADVEEHKLNLLLRASSTGVKV